MADTYSSQLRMVLQEPGANRNLWGTIFNSGVIDLLEEALAGISEIDVTTGEDVDLAPQNGLTDDARPMFLRVVGNPGEAVTITVPTLSKLYVVLNETAPAAVISFKTALSDPIEISTTQSPVMIFIDATNNSVRTIGRPNAILPMTEWTNLSLAVNNRTSGDATIVARYAKQGHFVFFEIPTFNTTTSDGTLNLTPSAPGNLMPAAIRPGTGIGSPAAVEFPIWIEGGAAGVEWVLRVQTNGAIAFSNAGTGSVSAPDTYSTAARLCFVWSTRGP